MNAETPTADAASEAEHASPDDPGRFQRLIDFVKRNIKDNVLRTIFVGSIVFAVVGNLLYVLVGGSLSRALDVIAVLFAFVFAAILITTLSHAVQTIPAGAKDDKVARVRVVQTNAWKSFVGLLIIGFVLYGLAIAWRTSWREMKFDFYSWRWSQRLATLSDVVNNVRANDQYGSELLSNEVVTMPVEEMYRLIGSNNVISRAEYKKVLKLMTNREVAEINGLITLRPRPSSVAIVAAKKIVLRRDAKLVYGSTDLLLMAYEFQFEDGSVIQAFHPDDVPIASGSSAIDGANAGTLRLVSLGPYIGQGTLRINAFGQIGSEGPRGADGVPFGPSEWPKEKDEKVVQIQPKFSVRQYEDEELQKAIKLIDSAIVKLTLDDSRRGDLHLAKNDFVACLSAPKNAGACRAWRCDNIDKWIKDAKGVTGYKGRAGGSGVPGGKSGRGGEVYVSLVDTRMQDHIKWDDGKDTDINKIPNSLPNQIN